MGTQELRVGGKQPGGRTPNRWAVKSGRAAGLPGAGQPLTEVHAVLVVAL